MYLAEQITGLPIDPNAKQLTRCRDDKAVTFALDAFASEDTDKGRFRVVSDFASNSLRKLLGRLGITTYAAFASRDSSSLIFEPGVGRMRRTELLILQRLFKSVETQQAKEHPQCVSPFAPNEQQSVFPFAESGGIVQPFLPVVSVTEPKPLMRLDDTLPPKYTAKLSTRLRRVLEREHVALTPRAIVSIDMATFSEWRSVGRLVTAEMCKLREDCISGVVWDYEEIPVVVKPCDFPSFAAYVRHFLEGRFDLSGNRSAILRDYMALQDGGEKKSLAALGDELGLTRERVRQIALKMEAHLKSLVALESFTSFTAPVARYIDENGSFVESVAFTRFIDETFSWQGTLAFSVVELMRIAGFDIALNEDGIVALGFTTNHKPRYDAFIRYVNAHKGRIGILSYDEMAKVAAANGFDKLGELEYRFYVRYGMTKRIEIKRKNGKRKLVLERDITSLRAKQYFGITYSIAYGMRQPSKAPFRREVMLALLEEAGYKGLTVDEVFEKAQERAPDLEWTIDSVRGTLSGGLMLDGAGIKAIPYERGRVNGDKTRFTLTKFFNDAKTKTVLEQAAQEIKSYMEESGFGVISIWRTWRKYRDKTPRYLPKLGFYAMMREFNSGGLNYTPYPRIAHPTIGKCEKAYQWELFQYFTYCGRKSATSFECLSFFVDCLGIDPVIASATVFPATGMKRVSDDETDLMPLKMPKKNGMVPQVLLNSVKSDPSLSRLSKPDRHLIASCCLDENGKAFTMSVYVRLFLRDLEASGCALSHDDVACLSDPGWCRSNLKIPRQFLWPAGHGERPIKHKTWREPYSFGGESYYINCDWEVRSKSAFDAWAANIAARVGIKFIPYDLESPDAGEEEG